MLAPSSRARDLLAGRRALQRGADADVIAVGPSIPLSRRTNMGVPVAVRANLRLALAHGRFDVVHGFEPGLPSLSYLALTSTHALTAATFFSVDRLGYPARRSRRDRLRARVDALLATSAETAEAAARAIRGRVRDRPARDRPRALPARRPSATSSSSSSKPAGRQTTRALLRLLDDAPGWEAVLRPHEAARVPADDPAAPALARPRPRDAHARAARRCARPGVDLRLGARRRRPARAGGGRLRGRARRRNAPTTSSTRSSGSSPIASARAAAARDARARAETAELRRRRRRARRGLREARPQAPRRAHRGRRPARGPRLDHDRPPPPHGLVARLLDPRRGPARPCRGDRARRHRRHRPQRLRWCPRSRRARARTATSS